MKTVYFGILFLIIFTLIVISPGFFKDIDAIKSKGVSNTKYGTATSDIVCGDKLCNSPKLQIKNNISEEIKENEDWAQKLSNILIITRNENSIYAIKGNISEGFESPKRYDISTKPSTDIWVDFDNDGNLDKARISASPVKYVHHGDSLLRDHKLNKLFISLGTMDGKLDSHETYQIGYMIPEQIASTDFNNDGNKDIIIVKSGIGQQMDDETIILMLNNGDATFGKPILVYQSTQLDLTLLGVGDFNNDGNKDVYFKTHRYNSGISDSRILFGDGQGKFNPLNYFESKSLRMTDINHDGIDDYAVLRENSYVIMTRENNKPITINTIKAEEGFSPIGFVEINNDSNNDMILYNKNTNLIMFSTGDGNGNFQNKKDKLIKINGDLVLPSRNMFTGMMTETIKVFDGNNDGNNDIMFNLDANHAISFLIGDGSGNFTNMELIFPNNSYLFRIYQTD